MRENIIVFGEDWGRHPSSTQHLMHRLAFDANIIWVNSLGLRRPRFDVADWQRIANKAKAMTKIKFNTDAAAAPSHSFCEVVNPRTLPFPGSYAAAFINRYSLRRQITPLINTHNMQRPLLWTSLPTALPAVGALGERAVVYYAGDDFGALAGVDHAPILEMEQKLADKADLIIAASALIAERFSPGKTRVLLHGVDYDLFATPAPRAVDLPVGRPIAGFYGSLNHWIDLESIAAAARHLPAWDFVLIGKHECDVGVLKTLPNIKLLGPRPHSALPSYCQHFEVALLPFKRNRQIDASNPLKLREYLASGVPIVASYRFAAAEAYGDAIAFCDDGHDLSEAIVNSNNNLKAISYRQKLVKKESWENRVKTLKKWMSDL